MVHPVMSTIFHSKSTEGSILSIRTPTLIATTAVTIVSDNNHPGQFLDLNELQAP